MLFHDEPRPLPSHERYHYNRQANAVPKRIDKISVSENQKRQKNNLYVQQIKGILQNVKAAAESDIYSGFEWGNDFFS